MIKWLAQLVPWTAACEDALTQGLKRPVVDLQDRLHIKRLGTVLWLGTESEDEELLHLSTVRQAMQIVDQCAAECTAVMRWAFSSVRVSVNELAPLLRRWDETSEPPILSIIDLQIGDAQHMTNGLKVFIGHEIAARFADENKSRDAARSLARLSRYALIHGRIDPSIEYHLLDGHPLDLKWTGAEEPEKLVTIVL